MCGNYVDRARALLNRRFRLQGRGEEGLDCIGVVLATYEISPREIRRDYRLRGDDRPEIERELNRHFRRVSIKQMRAGDVMLFAVASDQLHLGVRTDAGFVHAHAGLGRVVETPGDPSWPILGVYRRRSRSRRL